MIRTFITALLLLSTMSVAEARPAKWCGWYMMQVENVTNTAYWQARHWLNFGSNAGGPCVGCIVVWAHHVGKIVGQTAEGWIVHSGNDGHTIRTRVRKLNKAIGFRRP